MPDPQFRMTTTVDSAEEKVATVALSQELAMDNAIVIAISGPDGDGHIVVRADAFGEALDAITGRRKREPKDV